MKYIIGHVYKCIQNEAYFTDIVLKTKKIKET